MRATQGGLQIAQSVVVSRLVCGERAGAGNTALVSHQTAIFQDSVVVAHDRATFTAGNDLVGVETEDTRVTEAPRCASVQGRTQSLAGVFHNRQVMPPGDSQDSVHICKTSEYMDHQDRTRGRRNRFLDLAGIDIQRIGADIDKYRKGTDMVDRICCRDECEGSRDDFVARPHPCRLQRQFQTGGSGTCADGTGRPTGLRQCILEIEQAGAEAEAAAFQGPGDLCNIAWRDVGTGEGDQVRH